MVLNDKMVTLTKKKLLTNSGFEFITTLLNHNTREALYLIAVYKPPKMHINNFCCILETIIKQMPQNIPTIIIGDFNVNILIETCQSTTLHNFMNTKNFNLLFSQYTTINKNTNRPHMDKCTNTTMSFKTINMFTSHLDCQTMCLVSLHQQIKHVFTSSKQQSQFFSIKVHFCLNEPNVKKHILCWESSSTLRCLPQKGYAIIAGLILCVEGFLYTEGLGFVN
jgi:hypothetical protein